MRTRSWIVIIIMCWSQFTIAQTTLNVGIGTQNLNVPGWWPDSGNCPIFLLYYSTGFLKEGQSATFV